MNSEEARDTGAMIDARRARGDHRFDPVRFRFIEVLARRAGAHGGDARRLLDDKVVQLLAVYGEDLEKARCADSHPASPAATESEEAPSPRGALAELVDHIARHAASPENGPPAGEVAPGLSAFSELKTLRNFRSTWSRLSADRRLTQSLAKVPQNAGPLNSHNLVHQSLALMRDLSPEYLNRFMSYVDALLWVERIHGSNAATGAETPRTESQKKATRGKSGPARRAAKADGE